MSSYRALLKSKRGGVKGRKNETTTTTTKRLDDETIVKILQTIAHRLRVNEEVTSTSGTSTSGKNNALFKHHAEVLHGDTDASYTWKRKALELVDEEEEEDKEEEMKMNTRKEREEEGEKSTRSSCWKD